MMIPPKSDPHWHGSRAEDSLRATSSRLHAGFLRQTFTNVSYSFIMHLVAFAQSLASAITCSLLLLYFPTLVDAFANDDGKGRPPNGRLLYAWGRDNSNQLSQGDFNSGISTLVDRSKCACCVLRRHCSQCQQLTFCRRHSVGCADRHSHGPR